MVLIVSALRHRDRIPLAVLALLGVFSVHITGGVVTVMFVAAWWLFDALWRPVRGRLADFVSLLLVAVPTVLLLLPQFVGVLQQAEIIAGHAFVTHEGKKRALFDAVVQHTRHLNDYPIQNMLILLAAIGGSDPAGPAGLVAAGGVAAADRVDRALVGAVRRPDRRGHRQVQRPVLQRPAPAVGGGDDAAGADGRHRAVHGGGVRRRPVPAAGATGAARGPGTRHRGRRCVVACRRHWPGTTLPRHRYLIGEKYDKVMVDDKDLEAFAYLATLPGARDTLIGNANTDGTAWMYAVAGLHPLWTHYDYPQQQGPGYHRFIFWAYADDADTDPRVAEAVHALEHPVRDHQHTGGPRVRHARRASVARQVAVVEEDLRQRRGPHLRMARRRTRQTMTRTPTTTTSRSSATIRPPMDDGRRRQVADRSRRTTRQGHADRHHDQAAARRGPGGTARRRQPQPAARDPPHQHPRARGRPGPRTARGTRAARRCPSPRTRVPSDAELRIAQAQLVGWLEGLFHGIQTALFAQQMAARAQLEQMRQGALPPGVVGPGQRGPGHSGTGQYL